MCAGILSLFKRNSHNEKKQKSHRQRHGSNSLDGLSELAVPPPVEHRNDGLIHRRHSLEENLAKVSRGEDVDDDDAEDEDILVRHHTLEENIELAKELSAEINRQSQEAKSEAKLLSKASQQLSQLSNHQSDTTGHPK